MGAMMSKGKEGLKKVRHMQNHVILGALAALLVGCAASEPTEFDPTVDERIGEEVSRACFSSTSSRGGYIEVGGRDAFITGRFKEPYLLVFSRGCGDIDYGGAAPVFRNYGDNCRRRGELVRTFQTDFGVSGGCLIQHIYEWDRKTPEDEAAEMETGETG